MGEQGRRPCLTLCMAVTQPVKYAPSRIAMSPVSGRNLASAWPDGQHRLETRSSEPFPVAQTAVAISLGSACIALAAPESRASAARLVNGHPQLPSEPPPHFSQQPARPPTPNHGRAATRTAAIANNIVYQWAGGSPHPRASRSWGQAAREIRLPVVCVKLKASSLPRPATTILMSAAA